MADAPWRCSECGTVNEPVANSCRTCGKWPSLFDLQESVFGDEPVEHAELAQAIEPSFEVETFETRPFEVEQHVPDSSRDVPPPALEADAEVEREPEIVADRRRRIITSLIVPLAFVVYIVVSIIFGDRGSG